MEWLMVGTSPSVETTLDRFDGFTGRVITTNGGICICSPDVYVGVDGKATPFWSEQILAAKSIGCLLVTLHRDSEAALKTRNVDWYDEFIRCGDAPHIGGYGRFRFSGPLCLEYACNHGATVVHLVGFDGYRFQGDYTTEITRPIAIHEGSKTHGVAKTADVLKPACEDIARAWNHVRFIQYGSPTFSVEAANWEVAL